MPGADCLIFIGGKIKSKGDLFARRLLILPGKYHGKKFCLKWKKSALKIKKSDQGFKQSPVL
jgi:hypothetical protein